MNRDTPTGIILTWIKHLFQLSRGQVGVALDLKAEFTENSFNTIGVSVSAFSSALASARLKMLLIDKKAQTTVLALHAVFH